MSRARKFSVSPDKVYRLFYPQVPTILCARDGSSVAAMPANSAISLSNSPSYVGVAVTIGSKTERVLSAARDFSLCWLCYSKRTKELITRLSIRAPAGADKLKAFGIPYRTKGGIPVVKEAEAFLLCRKISSKKYGDHVFFVGKVESAKASFDFARDKYWRFEEYKPVLYLGSKKQSPFKTL